MLELILGSRSEPTFGERLLPEEKVDLENKIAELNQQVRFLFRPQSAAACAASCKAEVTVLAEKLQEVGGLALMCFRPPEGNDLTTYVVERLCALFALLFHGQRSPGEQAIREVQEKIKLMLSCTGIKNSHFVFGTGALIVKQRSPVRKKKKKQRVRGHVLTAEHSLEMHLILKLWIVFA